MLCFASAVVLCRPPPLPSRPARSNRKSRKSSSPARSAGVDGIVHPRASRPRRPDPGIHRQAASRPVDRRHHQHASGRRLPEQRPVRLVGRNADHPRLRRSRISQTFDGLPLNDTGNYALYSNQQLDPELIQQVNVNLGTTDVDSPTAAATARPSTIVRSTRPRSRASGCSVRSATGTSAASSASSTPVSSPLGARAAWVAGSYGTNENPYQRTSKTRSSSITPRSISRSAATATSSRSPATGTRTATATSRRCRCASTPRRASTELERPRVVGSGSTNRFPLTTDERDYTLHAVHHRRPAGRRRRRAEQLRHAYDYSYNPSNTGNIRINSKFTLANNSC